jgi:hypothetical protein
MMENFRADSAVGYPSALPPLVNDSFAYGAFTLSIQADGSLYYLYQQGIPSPVQGILARTLEGQAPQYPTNAGLIGLDWPGGDPHAPNTLLSTLGFGVYRGEARVLGKQENMARIGQLGNAFSVAYEITEEVADGLGGGTVTTSFGDEDALLQNITSVATAFCVCIDSIVGENPVGECIQVSTNIPSVLEEYSLDVMWETISVQEDGRLYWTLLSGMVGVADAYLAIDSDKPGASGRTDDGNSEIGSASAAGIAAAAVILLVVVGLATRQTYGSKASKSARLVMNSSLIGGEGRGCPTHDPETELDARGEGGGGTKGNGYDKLADV